MIVRQNSVFVVIFLLPLDRFRDSSYAWFAGNDAERCASAQYCIDCDFPAYTGRTGSREREHEMP
jgi:hypothetical protein